MPCGNRPYRKVWDKPKKLKVIKSSRYEQNEASVKEHWKNVVRALEMSYKDEKFWDSNTEIVRELVGPITFARIAKIFNLPITSTKYKTITSSAEVVNSEQFYVKSVNPIATRSKFSVSSFESSTNSLEGEEEELSTWSMTSVAPSLDVKKSSIHKVQLSSKSMNMSAKNFQSKTFSKFILRLAEYEQAPIRGMSKSKDSDIFSDDTQAFSNDDLYVNAISVKPHQWHYDGYNRKPNPYFDMLYCNESETDMIKWKSHYKQKTFEVSASDEFSKRAEILSKMISKEFYDWWVSLGNVEFKSEIRRPEDIEALFQVWFDEHASRGLVLNPKILPCIKKDIAEYIGVPQAACSEALARQINYDIEAETAPAHKRAFDTSLPKSLMHVPPKNNTSKLWAKVNIPDELRTMAFVFEDIQNLTSTKTFHQWLRDRPALAMPLFFRSLEKVERKKTSLAAPSDYIGDRASGPDLSFPVSQLNIELKDVLSKLMRT